MKLCKIIIQPETGFGTPLKGDTIFGHFCWQASESKVLNGGLDKWIASYHETPFVLFSSAFPIVRKEENSFYAMPRPFLPATTSKNMAVKERYQRLMNRKKDKKRKYLLVGEDLKVIFSKDRYCSEEDLFKLHLVTLSSGIQKKLKILTGKQQKFSGVFAQAHNTLNRLTNTTGTGQFAPFSSENIHYLPDAELAVFALFDEKATDIDRIKNAFVNMGRWGYGRDASTGLGRFKVIDTKEMKIPEYSQGACYTLAPCVPEKNSYATSCFTPFTRFGKHGAVLISEGKPFKNPVVMADEGAVFVPQGPQNLTRPYIGIAVTNLSKADARTVMQGYSIFLPCNFEESL